MEIIQIWKKQRKKFLLKMSIFSFVFYLSLPVSIGLFPEFMSQPRFGWLSWAWIYSFVQIGMTWVLGWIYWRKSKELDELIAEMEHKVEALE